MFLVKIRDFDMSNFVEYCCLYNGADKAFSGTQESLLQYWEPAKNEYLYDLLGGNLIISKAIHYERTDDELLDKIHEVLDVHRRFFNALREQVVRALGGTIGKFYAFTFKDEEDQAFYEEILGWSRTYALIDGTVLTAVKATIGGKLIKFNQGEKIMRAMRKLCAALAAIGYEDLTEDFEQMRLDHSRALNQKTTQGELCLSIHPLDYATASDNANGWSSCMSWQEDGCYRLGTVEMMNSPMVICAYLKSNVQEMKFHNYTWPSKKWRAWIIVTKDSILCNRNYPYTSDELSREAIKWVKDLAEANLGWEYRNEILSVDDWQDKLNATFFWSTNYMYNDVRNDMLMVPSVYTTNEMYDINYSGIANCMNCGKRILYDDGEAGTLCCEDCRLVKHCECCGCAIDPDSEHFYGPNDELYCEDCYYDNVVNCHICNTDIYAGDAIKVQIPFNKRLFAELTGDDTRFTPYVDVNICPDCAQDLDLNFLPNDFTVENGLIPTFAQDNLIDPRTTSIYSMYKLMDYRLNSDNSFKFNYEKQSAEKMHLVELWEDYRQYVINELGEAE